MPSIDEVEIRESVSCQERIIASKLFGARTRMNVEREDLAAMVGIDEVDLAEYENGLQAIPASELFMLASAMGISVNYFYTDDKEVCSNSVPEEEASALLS